MVHFCGFARGVEARICKHTPGWRGLRERSVLRDGIAGHAFTGTTIVYARALLQWNADPRRRQSTAGLATTEQGRKRGRRVYK